MTLAIGQIRSVEELLAVARAMEERSAERYAELAEAFEVSCNRDTADAFHELAALERRHAEDFPAVAGNVPQVVPWGAEAPEIADPGCVHYLMLPWHAFDLALRHEHKAMEFFSEIAARSPNPGIKVAAHGLAEREQTHVALLTARRDSFPQPHPDWDEDPDPPNWDM